MKNVCLFLNCLVLAVVSGSSFAAEPTRPIPVADLVRSPVGRLAIVADGNSPDPDDIGATAVIFGLLKESGLSDRLVHLSHSCDLKPTSRIPVADELRRQKVMDQVCRDGVRRFGPFRNLVKWFNCRTQQKEAVDDLRKAINKSSKNDPLWIIEAGEPDVIGYALEAADASKREYVHVVSHHPANDNAGDFFTWQQILDYGVKEHQIGDQNVGLKTATTAWDWAKDHKLPGIQWIWKQLAYAEQDGVVRFQTNHFDCSDAGMVYWWITGADRSGNKHATPVDIAALLEEARSLAAASRPNILLIVADDVGYSDLGCYGGEIDTPNLDQLAAEGLRFSEFHVNPMCVVTRTSLLTGHEHSQSDNYRRSQPIARLMRDAGYATSISGKWHQPGNPLDAGFDSFYGFLGGAIDSWTGFEAGKPVIQANREQPRPVPEGWYSSDAFTDDAIRQIDAACGASKPFFTYLAFNAPHSPLHAPRENVEKYYDRYLTGWESLRQQRFTRMREMGLIDDRYVMSQPEAEVRRWDELPESIQKQESRRMAAYAGMLERLDWNVGRLLRHLQERGQAENTLVIVFADNGGDYSNGDIRTYDAQVPWKPGTNPYASNGWAYLKNTPFRWYKSSAHEGGVSVPMIVRWPAKLADQAGGIRRQRLHVTDLYPTFLELAGASYPATDGDRKLEPLYGKSLLPLLNDAALPDRAIHDEIFWCFNQTGKGLTNGDWKISSINDGPWRLYNVEDDPAESRDLAAEKPEVLHAMSDRWFEFATHHTTMPSSWRSRLKNYQEGWGFHRIRMSMPAFVRAVPASSAMDVPCDTDLTFHFSQPVSFADSAGKTLRLYEAGDVATIVWQADPEPGHAAEGTNQVTFDDLPRLKPDTTYFALSDSGWITLGGKRAIGLNDGAFWYRFRTAEH